MEDRKVTLALSDGISLNIPLAVFKAVAKGMDEKATNTINCLENDLRDRELEITRYKRQQKIFDMFVDALIRYCHLMDDDYFTIFDKEFASTPEEKDKLISVVSYFINSYHANRQGQEEYIQNKGYLEE